MADFVSSMPGDCEAAGAIAGMQDTYGRPLAVGESVTYRLPGWGPSEWERGIIREVCSTALVVEVDGDRGLMRPVAFDCILPL